MTTTVRQAIPSDAGTLARLVEQYWAFEAIENYDYGRVERLIFEGGAFTFGRVAVEC
jgi:hypothetical protein